MLSKYRTRGFSIAELALLVLILGIVSAIVMPRFGGSDFLPRLNLKTNAYQVASDLRYARALAVAETVNHILELKFGDNSYGVYRGSAGPGNVVGEVKYLPASISLSGANSFTFNSLGSCAIAGGNYLTLSSGSHSYNVKVDQITGSPIVEVVNP